jgi:tagatose-1,6-bisphosphate aldolase
MTSGIASGKRKGLEAVADSRGVIAALAIDQRAAIRSLFAKTMAAEPASVPAEMLVTFKEAVSRILTPHASTILLDPEYGLPAAKHRARSAGLLLAYGVAVFVEHGLTALEDWWHSEGARNVENVNKHLRAAKPWSWMTE